MLATTLAATALTTASSVRAQSSRAEATFDDLLFRASDAAIAEARLTLSITVTNSGLDRAVAIGVAEAIDAAGNTFQLTSAAGNSARPLANGATTSVMLVFDDRAGGQALTETTEIRRLTLPILIGGSSAASVTLWDIPVKQAAPAPAPRPPAPPTPPTPPTTPAESRPLAPPPNRPITPSPPTTPTRPSASAQPPASEQVAAGPAPFETGACPGRPETTRFAVDEGGVFWLRDDGRILEQPLGIRFGLVPTASNGSGAPIGGVTFGLQAASCPAERQRPLGDGRLDPRLSPRIVPGIRNAVGVAAQQIVWFGTSAVPNALGLSMTRQGLQFRDVRVALLADGSVAMWGAGIEQTIFSARQILALLRSPIAALQGGVFVLEDGTVEDTVIERLAGQPEVMRAIFRGISATKCRAVFCEISPRSSAQLPSFKYQWSRSRAPARCVRSVSERALLLQNGEVHLNASGSIGEGPLLSGVQQFSDNGDALAAVKADGTLWYWGASDDWPLPRQLAGIERVSRVWVAARDVSLDGLAARAARLDGRTPPTHGSSYVKGVWYSDQRGRLFRWAESADSLATQADPDQTEPPNPIEIPIAGATGVGVEGEQTVVVDDTGTLLAWMPEEADISSSASFDKMPINRACWWELGDAGPGRITYVDPIRTDPQRSLVASGINTITTDRRRLADATNGRAVEGVAADGTTRVLLKIPAFETFGTLSLEIVSKECLTTEDPSACRVLDKPSEHGGFLALNNQSAVPPASAISLQVERNANPDSSGEVAGVAYAVYRAPMDFTTVDGQGEGTDRCSPFYSAEECERSVRPVVIRLRRKKGAVERPSYQTIQVTRPPLLLLHGFNGTKADWNPLRALIKGTSTGRDLGLVAIDYSTRVPVSGLDPDFSAQAREKAVWLEHIGDEPVQSGGFPANVTTTAPVDLFRTVPASALGVDWNAARIFESGVLEQAIACYKLEREECAARNDVEVVHSQIPVAAVQFDAIGHDLGGLIAESLSQKGMAAGKPPFHKLITLGTPHLGAPLFKELVDAGHTCTATWTAIGTAARSEGPVLILRSAALPGGQRTSGAAADMAGSGIEDALLTQSALNVLRQQTRSSGLPVATIAAALEFAQLRDRRGIETLDPVDWLDVLLHEDGMDAVGELSDWAAPAAMCRQHPEMLDDLVIDIVEAAAEQIPAIQSLANHLESLVPAKQRRLVPLVEKAKETQSAIGVARNLWTASLYWQLDTNIDTRLYFTRPEEFPSWLFLTRNASVQDLGIFGTADWLVASAGLTGSSLRDRVIDRLQLDLFGSGETDGVVQANSALAGWGPGRYLLRGLTHDSRTARNIGIAGPSLLDDARVANRILSLLNTSTGDTPAFSRNN